MSFKDYFRSRRFRLGASGIVVCLAPLGYWLAASLLPKIDPHTWAGFSGHRKGIVAKAKQYALDQGLETDGWNSFVTAETDDDLRRYLANNEGSAADKARELAPAITIRTLLFSKDRTRSFEAWLTVEGNRLGFRARGWTPDRQHGSDEKSAETIAKDVVKDLVSASGFLVEGPGQQPFGKTSLTVTGAEQFEWTLRTPALPGFSVRCVVVVEGGGLVVHRMIPRLPPRSSPLFGGLPLVVPRTLLVVVLVLILLLLDIRYFRKLWDREASGRRCAALTIFLVVLFIAIGEVFSDRWRFDLAEVLPPLGATIFPAYYRPLRYVLAFAFALILGLAWSRCESDVREIFPEKLTPLDAVLSGNILNRNVGRAFVFGAALAGWAVALKCLVWWPWLSQPGAGPGVGELEVFVARKPGLSALFLPLTEAVFHTLLGLLMPLSLLGRLVQLERWKYLSRFSRHHIVGILAVILTLYFTLDATLSSAPDSPAMGLVLKAAINSAVLLVPFVLFDVLVAFFTVLVSRVAMLIFYLARQPSPTLQQASADAVEFALLTFVVAVLLIFLTRRVSSEEVRPIYAENLEERLKLQSRVEAAQKVQRQMLPNREPKFPGGTVACSFRSVYQQGGDYHDYFELPGNKLGILLTEFSGQPLEAAVAIPLLKGFLLSYTRRQTEPQRVLLELDRRLKIPRTAIRSIVYLVVDSRRQTLEHARLGAEPPMILRREVSSKILRLRSPDARKDPTAREQFAGCDVLLLSTPRTVAHLKDSAWQADLGLSLRLAIWLSPARKAKWVLRWVRALVAPAGAMITVCLNRFEDA